MFHVTAILLCLAIPNALAAAPAKSKSPNFARLIDRVLTEGADTSLAAKLCQLIGLPSEDLDAKDFDVESAETSDGMTHNVKVLLDKSVQPVKIRLHTGYDWDRRSESYHMRVSTTGTLEMAVLLASELDSNGQTVRGSGKVVEKDINSREIRDRFQHELDFWLKGKYRKKKPTAPKKRN